MNYNTLSKSQPLTKGLLCSKLLCPIKDKQLQRKSHACLEFWPLSVLAPSSVVEFGSLTTNLGGSSPPSSWW